MAQMRRTRSGLSTAACMTSGELLQNRFHNEAVVLARCGRIPVHGRDARGVVREAELQLARPVVGAAIPGQHAQAKDEDGGRVRGCDGNKEDRVVSAWTAGLSSRTLARADWAQDCNMAWEASRKGRRCSWLNLWSPCCRRWRR